MRCHPERSANRSANRTKSKDLRLFLFSAVLCLARLAPAQQPTPPPASAPPTQNTASIASVSLQNVTVSGSLSVANGRAVIGSSGAIAAGDQTAHVALTRGGSLDVCSTTKVHLATDASTPGGALMISLDRGAFEAHYTAGQYSDVIMTPDLRILVSPPGQVDLSLRVNDQGDTCVDNRGASAPYVLATNLFSGGAYRIQPNQRVLFEHGSLNEVVDSESEPCGCPQPTPPAEIANKRSGKKHRDRNQNQAEAANPFPLAQSEGLTPPPPPATTPETPGVIHTVVQAPIAYSSASPNLPPPPEASAPATPAAAAPTPQKHHRGFFGHIGHFFKRIFGGK